MRMKITNAGRAKLVNDSNTGTNTVLICQIGLTSTGFTPTASMTQLPGEIKRMTSFGGESVAADTIHVTLQDSGTDKYPLRGFGLYLADGTLFAVYGQAEAIMEKASVSTLLLSADVVFADIDTAQIKFGSTQFLNPPATESVAGVVELADGPETIAGADAVRAVTARGLKAALDDRFGANAPTPFVKTVLALATAAAIRTALEVKGAALKDMGHGKGLDADTLDGMHAADFPQIGKVQTYDAIPGTFNQTRWIKLGTLPWTGTAASVLMLELTNGGVGSPRYVWEQVAASTRSFGDAITTLSQAQADGMVHQTRIGLGDALDRPSRIGLTLTRDSAGKSTGVDLWLQQREYSHGHAVRVVNVTGTTYHGVETFVTSEPAGIVYVTPQPVAYMSDVRRLVDTTENRWGRRQTFALGASLSDNQTLDLGTAGAALRGSAVGSVVLSAAASSDGGFVYLRPNGNTSTVGQLVVYKNGVAEMAGARIGAASGDGSVLLELYSQRPWQFKQGGVDGTTGLELHDSTGGKEFRLTNTANPNKIIFNPTGSWINAADFRGKLTGNADTASKLAAPRAINGTNFDGTNGITTATWGTARNVQIGNATKSVNGGANVSFTLAEIGAGSAADVAARVAYLAPTSNDDSWEGTWDALRINRQTNGTPTTMPAQYTIAWSLPSYDNSRGLAIAADYGGGNRFWMRSRRDTAPVDRRWKDWVELHTTASFDPATKADRIPGQVIMFAGKAAPAGTLLCNGAAVSRTTYADLFAAIGTLYGAGDGATTFNLPAMLEGTVVTHTQKPENVGTSTAGEVLRHAHTASSAAAGSHSHGASTGAAGDHAHAAWTDQQGHHAHTGSTNPAGEHQHGGVVPSSPALNGYGVYRERDNDALPGDGATAAAGNHAHSFTTDGAGGHSHAVGMNGSGNHTHGVSVAQGGEHSHSVSIGNSGGDRNLPAGLRMIYCIVH
ncbi:hypothetical protein A7X89_07140 [Stenotrophomonas maltophilia]|nr:hypothetical protein A7X89_07140 [Stenotrophomonas maltophilia]